MDHEREKENGERTPLVLPIYGSHKILVHIPYKFQHSLDRESTSG